MQMKFDITNQKFGRLLALKPTNRSAPSGRIWQFKCDCGKIISISRNAAKSGNTRSCGCLRRELHAKLARKKFTFHGQFGTVEWHTHQRMLQRCNNKNHNSWKDYGGRGISVCKRWENFELFFEDMGKRPSGTSLDRINNSLGYSKKNCRWATKTEQSNNQRSNRRVTYKGETMNLSQWARKIGMDHRTLYHRLFIHKWPIEKAFEKIVKKHLT